MDNLTENEEAIRKRRCLSLKSTRLKKCRVENQLENIEGNCDIAIPNSETFKQEKKNVARDRYNKLCEKNEREKTENKLEYSLSKFKNDNLGSHGFDHMEKDISKGSSKELSENNKDDRTQNDSELHSVQKSHGICSAGEFNDDIVQELLNDDFEYEGMDLDKDIAQDTDEIKQQNYNISSRNPSPNVKQISFCKEPVNTVTRKESGKMKQTDIAVFFGLKPKEATNKAKVEQNFSQLTTNQGQFTRFNGRQNIGGRKCPFYKIVDGTSFAVDAFSYGNIPEVTHYFLSHFHSDHYRGLKKNFANPIYCSKVTANLISLKIKVSNHLLHSLPLNETICIHNVDVTLIDANHCPGAVIFIFKLPNGKTHLHTGDFRATSMLETNPFLCSLNVHTLYLDTTYCDARYSFPPQSDAINYCVSIVRDAVAKVRKTLIVVGAYTIGKEKIFVAIADVLQCKVGVKRDKYNILQCLEWKHLQEIITQNYHEAQIHVLPMAHLTHQKLGLYLKEYDSSYHEILAIKPTGWTFTGSCSRNGLLNIQPSRKGSVTIYGVPYSEHSSFEELKNFVKFIKPVRVLPTVNNGSAAKRDEMQKLFKTWLET